MTYMSQSLLSKDADFVDRVAACASVEVPKMYQPYGWAVDHIWWLSAAPGFGDAYQYALDTDVPNPGADPGVITDGMILSAVQTLYAEMYPPEPAPPAPEPAVEGQPLA